MISNLINIFRLNKLLLILFILIISVGFYFCLINKYGWDWDTYTMINTYLNILQDGKYTTSRGHGYMVPEIGIGFLSYYFGSFITNSITFIFLIIGLIFIYKSCVATLRNQIFIDPKKEIELLIIFLILSLTNHVVFIDSTIPADFSWSLLFYSLGFYFIIKKQIELSLIFFSLCFGSRLNFIIFILPTIFFLSERLIDTKKKFLISFTIILFGGLFYLPIWLQAKFSLSFIFSNAWYVSGKKDGIFTFIEFARFAHKTISTLGVPFIIIAFIGLIIGKNKILIILKNFKFQITLIFLNLFLFFFFPWQPSYLWILILSLNFIFVHIFSKKILYLLILINLFNWFFQFKVVKINYLVDGCYETPISGKFQINFDKGILLNISSRDNHTKCYPDIIGKGSKIQEYKLQLSNGKKLSN
jgi:hypothetical protein